MDRFEKLTAVALTLSLVLSLIAFIAAGNPRIVEKQNSHHELNKIELESPTEEDVVVKGKGVWTSNTITEVACEGGVRHTKTSNSHFVSVTSYNGSGYCYYIETGTSKKLVFYGLEIISVPTTRGENHQS